MPHLIGLVLFVYGSGLLYYGLRHRRRYLAAPPDPSAPEGSLAILGDIMPPLIIIGLGLAGLEVILAYVMIDPSRWFSLFDLFGVLYLLLTYGIWMTLKTRYRGGAG